MGTHDSSVNFEHLIKDLAEMYPFDVAEVVLVELVANCLDAKATRIDVDFDADTAVLVVEDNGRGMTREEFEQYHDFAAGLKVRGAGIGFAGVGAKISFNIADKVITETRGKSLRAGSRWYLKSKKQLVWDDIPPTALKTNGTRVEVHFRRQTALPFTTRDDLLKVLKRHYLPLFDPKFLSFYEQVGWYPADLRFTVNKKEVPCLPVAEACALDKIHEFMPRAGGKRIGFGIVGVSKDEYPLGPEMCGLVLCTHGKTVKPEFFNQFPGQLGPRIFGVVEVPELVKFLTTSKTDFMRRGKHRQFERLYDPIRQDFKSWLHDLGIESIEMTLSDEAAKLERELRKILDEIPELSEFLGASMTRQIFVENQVGPVQASEVLGAIETAPVGEGEKGLGEQGVLAPSAGTGTTLERTPDGGKVAAPISRKMHRGPRVKVFADAPQRVDLAWVEGPSVIINSGHSCYNKFRANPAAIRLHNIYAIAGAVQRYVQSAAEEPNPLFVDRLMSAWASK